MKIEVRRHGFGTPIPEGINRWIQIGDSVVADPKWISYHRNNRPLMAIDKADNFLPIGEYDGKLTYQYYLESAKTWFNCRNLHVVRDKLSDGFPTRLVILVDDMNNRRVPKITNGNKEIKDDEAYRRHL